MKSTGGLIEKYGAGSRVRGWIKEYGAEARARG